MICICLGLVQTNLHRRAICGAGLTTYGRGCVPHLPCPIRCLCVVNPGFYATAGADVIKFDADDNFIPLPPLKGECTASRPFQIRNLRVGLAQSPASGAYYLQL